ncbi:MAG: HAMP domain-containing sensor histidine kinase [Dysgonomonas sp.]
MKVQNRLSLFSSIVFGIIFAIMSLLIYMLYSQNAKKTIFDNLKKTSYITAIFYLEEDELNKDEFAKAKAQFDEFANNSYYQIYDQNNNVSYGSESINIDVNILNTIREKQNLMFEEEDYLCFGIFYEDNQGDFVVITREKRDELANQQNMLLWILLASFSIGLISIIFLSKWIANIAYRPFRVVIRQVDNISTKNLDVQIKSPNTKDELQDLITTFNKLLAKISETVLIQKNFASYVSHEFRTPLASMLGNIEVFSLKDRSPEEYKELSVKMIEQIHQLENILNTLMVISDLRKNTDTIVSLRIDELIWEIIDKISERYINSKIQVNIDIQPEDEDLLSISKDRTELLMALFNLIENAVKYSRGEIVNIYLYKENDSLSMQIEDKGIGIPKEQLDRISKPFYRANNTNQIQGSGIGLSIALRILDKNNISYRLESDTNTGTRITLSFKQIND